MAWLHLNGVSTNDFPSALQAVFGETAKTQSPNTIVRHKEQWTQEYEQWCKRDLSDRHCFYFWVDGIHVKVRLGDEADRNQCILVIIGATTDGRKELVAVADGYRESEASWTDVLVDLKRRGLNLQPKLAIGDGALGFWAAIRKTMPQTAEQRCWVHKTANILNKLPKSLQSKAKSDLHEIWMSPTSKQANQSFDNFLEDYGLKHPKVAERLSQNREELMPFYQFPAEHREHIRSTNPIASSSDEGKRKSSNKPCDAVQDRREGFQRLEARRVARNLHLWSKDVILRMNYWSRTSPKIAFQNTTFDNNSFLDGAKAMNA